MVLSFRTRPGCFASVNRFRITRSKAKSVAEINWPRRPRRDLASCQPLLVTLGQRGGFVSKLFFPSKRQETGRKGEISSLISPASLSSVLNALQTNFYFRVHAGIDLLQGSVSFFGAQATCAMFSLAVHATTARVRTWGWEMLCGIPSLASAGNLTTECPA